MRDGSEFTFAVASVVVAAVVVAAAITISRTQSQTFDEPIHVAAGLEWLQYGRYTLWTETPPIGRVALALRPYWNGVRLDSRQGNSIDLGNAALYRDGAHQRHLTDARFGTWPFFALVLLVVWLWARRAAGPAAGFIVTAMVATLPAMVAHAALATTDMAFTATFLVATYAFVRWLERPGWEETLALGAGIGVSVATKFSALVFFPPVALAIALTRLEWERRGRAAIPAGRFRPASLSGILAVAAVVVWASYRLSIGTIAALPPTPGSIVIAADGRPVAAMEALEHAPLPAPELFHGLLALADHDRQGQRAYALGAISETGFRYFYLLALAVKTPVSFLLFVLLSGATIEVARRRDSAWSSVAALISAAVILAASASSRVNLGIRHVLPIYPFLAISSGLGCAALMQSHHAALRIGSRIVLPALLAAQLFTLWRIHPDELAYFNALAGSTPGDVLVDSDLDWGQDLARLGPIARSLGIDRLNIAYFGTARLCEPDLPPMTWLPPGQPRSGWVAISEDYLRGVWRPGRRDVCDVAAGWTWPPSADDYSWLRAYQPVAWAGRSIRVYHIPSIE